MNIEVKFNITLPDDIDVAERMLFLGTRIAKDWPDLYINNVCWRDVDEYMKQRQEDLQERNARVAKWQTRLT